MIVDAICAECVTTNIAEPASYRIVSVLNLVRLPFLVQFTPQSACSLRQAYRSPVSRSDLGELRPQLSLPSPQRLQPARAGSWYVFTRPKKRCSHRLYRHGPIASMYAEEVHLERNTTGAATGCTTADLCYAEKPNLKYFRQVLTRPTTEYIVYVGCATTLTSSSATVKQECF